MEERLVGHVTVRLAPLDRAGRVFDVRFRVRRQEYGIHFEVPTYVRRKYSSVLEPEFIDEVAELAVAHVITEGGEAGYVVGQAAGKMGVVRARQRPNPAGGGADDLYRAFHQNEPRWVIEGRGFKMPRRVRKAGPATEVQYRSNKRDPETGRPVKRARDYYHEHGLGVCVYLTDGRADTLVPRFITEVTELALLGECLGFFFEDGDQEIEGKVVRPYPKLYSIPSGRALLVIQDERQVLALIWGGQLGVEPRGIVH